MRTSIAILVLAFLAGLPVECNAQQRNSRAASASCPGARGAGPLIARIENTAGHRVSLEVRGLPGQPLIIVHAPAGVRQGALHTKFGIVDLDLSLGAGALMDGIGFGTKDCPDPEARLDGDGAFEIDIPVDASGTTHVGGLQVLVGDPSSPAGYRLTAAIDLTVINLEVKPVYVSERRGFLSWPGTSQLPVSSISAAIQISLRHGPPYRPVRVAVGTYVEPLDIVNGISILGGLDNLTWVKTGQRSVVRSGVAPATAWEITQPTLISGIEFRADDATLPGEASVALQVQDAISFLEFVDCSFHAGNGASGLSGLTASKTDIRAANGESGSPGRDGGGGGRGAHDATSAAHGGTGGSGTGGDGQQGGGLGVRGGAGGLGGTGPGDDGSAGEAGLSGQPGHHGSPSQVGGTVTDSLWLPGAGESGRDGTSGSGGGGGGGGAHVRVMEVTYLGGGGGGAGAGGRGGKGGQGGQNGGGSFAVVLIDASPTFIDCVFNSTYGGHGGNGGHGIPGQHGGFNGTGGRGDGPAGDGDRGGAGGQGGPGGAGAGGSGGPSWCLFLSESSDPNLPDGNEFSHGAGGFAGRGGLHGDRRSWAPDGHLGEAGPFGPLSGASSGSLHPIGCNR